MTASRSWLRAEKLKACAPPPRRYGDSTRSMTGMMRALHQGCMIYFLETLWDDFYISTNLYMSIKQQVQPQEHVALTSNQPTVLQLIFKREFHTSNSEPEIQTRDIAIGKNDKEGAHPAAAVQECAHAWGWGMVGAACAGACAYHVHTPKRVQPSRG